MNPVSSGSFTTDQIGTNTVEVTYGTCSSGQNISITDSDSNFQCCDLNPASGTCQFISVVVNTSASVNITCTDGTCP